GLRDDRPSARADPDGSPRAIGKIEVIARFGLARQSAHAHAWRRALTCKPGVPRAPRPRRGRPVEAPPLQATNARHHLTSFLVIAKKTIRANVVHSEILIRTASQFATSMRCEPSKQVQAISKVSPLPTSVSFVSFCKIPHFPHPATDFDRP